MSNTLVKRLEWSKCLLVSLWLLRWIMAAHWVNEVSRVCSKSCRNSVEIDGNYYNLGETGSEHSELAQSDSCVANLKNHKSHSYHVNVVYPS